MQRSAQQYTAQRCLLPALSLTLPSTPSPTPWCSPRVGVSAALAPHSLKCVGLDERQVAVSGESGSLALWSLTDVQRALEVGGTLRCVPGLEAALFSTSLRACLLAHLLACLLACPLQLLLLFN